MGRNWIPKHKVKCEKCGWTGKRGNEAKRCPRCGHWHPRKEQR